MLQQPDLEALGGRGVLMVDGPSDDWGVVPHGPEKVVRCRLRPGAERRAVA